MKVTLDLSKLLHEGKITRAEFDRLAALGAEGTGSLAFNILIGFGVIAVALGAIALVPTPETAIALGAIVAAIGLGLLLTRAEQWVLLANICIVVGALLFAGGIVMVDEGSVRSYALVAAIFAAGGIAARSGLLIVAAVLAFSSCVGARTGYFHATYVLGIRQPTVTIVLFSLIAIGTYQLSKRLTAAYEGLALMAARTSVFLVNFGFWIGSLWGDRLVWLRRSADPAIRDFMLPPLIDRWHFSLLWAIALIATAAWAVRANRRWVVNICAVFGAIHFYTQWFERFGAQPIAILLAGLLALGIALGLWQFNRTLSARGSGPAVVRGTSQLP